MFTATTSALAAAAVIATGAVVGTSVPAPTAPAESSSAAVSETQTHEPGAGNCDHPGMAQMHEQMMGEHPGMARMHEQMMGDMGAGMMGGDSGMGR